ncbi:class I SAM-dependent methyltransferase [Aurantiacibacter sp. MUD11]|uniref:class I SAM-dependent methyltransferase n=1 Tax=Aurantiacibacter sp. MUD11 TaxID=3003265 RepID=UPI0022AA6A7A|nr:class I SAM-dependent methyltransferase [Aurantiacibacter sp. MUD11]WAT18761.1 class I SAM-dependent methyltransferase [Aurantiacibacter sp. MUD11]
MMALDPVFGATPPAGSQWVPSPGFLLRRNRILKMMRDIPGGDLLELGCGAGAMLADFAALGHRCTAVETSEAARAGATQFHAGNPSVTILSETDPSWRESFDCVVSFEVLEHIEEDREALSEWLSYLRPGGKLVLSVPAGPHRWDASDEWAGHIRRYTRDGLTDLVTSCGAKVEQVETYGWPLANMLAPIRARSKAKASAADSTAARTAESGIERSAERRMLPILKSLPGRLAMRGFFAMQAAAAPTDLGPGYLLLARKPAA